jgi:hypothetical protein
VARGVLFSGAFFILSLAATRQKLATEIFELSCCGQSPLLLAYNGQATDIARFVHHRHGCAICFLQRIFWRNFTGELAKHTIESQRTATAGVSRAVFCSKKESQRTVVHLVVNRASYIVKPQVGQHSSLLQQ